MDRNVINKGLRFNDQNKHRPARSSQQPVITTKFAPYQTPLMTRQPLMRLDNSNDNKVVKHIFVLNVVSVLKKLHFW